MHIAVHDRESAERRIEELKAQLQLLLGERLARDQLVEQWREVLDELAGLRASFDEE